MIENIRKYTGLMIVVLVLLFIGLVFLENSVQGALTGKPAMVVDGEKISQEQYRRLGADALKIPGAIPNSPLSEEGKKIAASYLGQSILDQQTFSGATLAYMGQTLGTRGDTFLANRIAVREAGLDYEVTPGPDEVETFIKKVLFADPDGKFNKAAYDEFIEGRLGSLGLDSRDFNHYLRDLLTAQNLSNLIGGSILPDTETVRASHLQESQTITGKEITLISSTFEANQNPTEDEIKAYWEENKQKYNSDERRAISYVMIEPDWAAKLAEVEAEKAKKEEERKKAEEEKKKKEEEERKKAEEAARKANEALDQEKADSESTEPAPQPTEETEAPTEQPSEESSENDAQGEPGEPGEEAPAPPTEKEADESPTETAETDTPAETPVVETTTTAKPAEKPEPPKEKTPKEKLNSVQKTEAVKAILDKANAFWDVAYEDIQANQSFAQIVENAGYTLVTTEPFTEADAPDALKPRVVGSQIGTLANVVFKIANGQVDERLSELYSTNEGYFVCFLEQVIESTELSYEEAKEKATADLKKEMAQKKLKERAAEVHEALAKAADAAAFEEEAKKLELTIKAVKDVKKPVIPAYMRYQVDISQFPQFQTPDAFSAAKGTDPDNVSDIYYSPNEESATKATIVFVEKREIKEDDKFTEDLGKLRQSREDQLRLAAFQNWLQNNYTLNRVDSSNLQFE